MIFKRFHRLFSHFWGMLSPSYKWDSRMMDHAIYISSYSKDETKVGAIIARGRHLVSTGYNGFPPGVVDNVPERHQRPAKYLYTAHAEENAIHTAHINGASVSGCTIYVPLFPCSACARAIISTGISRVVTRPIAKDAFFERWGSSIEASLDMFDETGVDVDYLEASTWP